MRISIDLSPEQNERLEALADLTGSTKSSVLRQLLNSAKLEIQDSGEVIRAEFPVITTKGKNNDPQN